MVKKPKICSYPGCKRKYFHGKLILCPSHKRRHKQNDIDQPIINRRVDRLGNCEFVGCGRNIVSGGLCQQHWKQKHKGQKLKPIRYKAPDGTGWIDEDGYHRIGKKLVHRTTMEKKLGRPLRNNETVHHINGIRLDNKIKNLELWVKRRQPSGQRVKDRIADAIAILKLYAPHKLKEQTK